MLFFIEGDLVLATFLMQTEKPFPHYGYVAGSAGCIDLTVHIDRFIKLLSLELKGLPECYIPLTVRYDQR